MFGYVIPNQAALSPEAQARYRTAYCGLCRRIGAGACGVAQRGSLTLQRRQAVPVVGARGIGHGFVAGEQGVEERAGEHGGGRGSVA